MSITSEEITNAIAKIVNGKRVEEISFKGVTTKYSAANLDELKSLLKEVTASENSTSVRRGFRTKAMSGGKGL